MSQPSSPSSAFLQGGGTLGELIRNKDWSSTPLGPVEAWPQSLKTTLGIMLNSRYPMFVFWGPELVKIYNDGYRPITGHKHPWALGRPAPEVWPEIWHDIEPLVARALGGDPTWSDNLLLFMERHGFREEVYFTFSYSPVPDETGGIGGMFCACTETTGEVLGERRLRVLRDLAAAPADARDVATACRLSTDVLGTNPADVPFAVVYLLDEHGEAALVAQTGVQPGAPAAPLRVSRDDLVRPWDVLAVAADREPRLIANLAATLDETPPGPWPEPPHAAMVLPLVDRGRDRGIGALVLGISARRPFDDEYREWFGLIGAQVSASISNARAVEDERRRVEALAEVDRAKTAFFSNVSHEFRTPLTLMLGPTEDALASGGVLSGEPLLALYRNELRLLKLVNALLDFSRLEAGRTRASYQPTRIAELTADLASLFRAGFERAGLAYTVACDPIGEPVFVDPDLWEKIVLNLLSNALKFTFEGGVTLRLQEHQDHVSLSVQDTGIGIAAEQLPHVFDRFHRVEGVRARTHEGTGIGLALVHDLVALHGGTASARSEPGRGTTIEVTIPKGAGHLPEDQLAPPRGRRHEAGPNPFVVEAERWLPQSPADGRVDRHGHDQPTERDAGRILVADDNADMRDYLVRLLAPHWDVHAVGDGEAALESVRDRRPDLVVADVMMPTVDGFALLEQLRADEGTRDIPLVMLSARAGDEARVEALEAGADDYLGKPFAARELLARVGTQMKLARGARERADLLAKAQASRSDAERQKQHLHALFMQAPVAIAVLRGERHVVEFANPVACRVWGRRPEQVMGLPLLDALPEVRQQQQWEMLLGDVYGLGETRSGTETPAQFDRDRSGVLETVYFDFVYTPLRDVHGTVEGVLVIASDVTTQVLARQQVDRLREVAEEANRAKDEFLAMLGHELRNPLAPILTALQLLKLRGVAGVERERALIERQVRHLVQLVDDLLDVSRITRGKIALRPEPIEVADVVTRAIEMASPLFEQQRHDLDVDVPRSGLMVHGDPARLAQVVANLLTNAAKYTEPVGRVTVRARSEDGWVSVEVRDTGVGIEPDVLPHIFDMFVQERQAIDRAIGGLGLGLAIVRSLVTQHGGVVTADSEGRGRGSVFTVRLPHLLERQQAPPLEAPAGRRHTPDGRRVLVVDDNRDAALMLVDMLTTLGYQARSAHDGPSAIALVEDFDPDVAFIDIGLPVMNGYELARRLTAGLAHPRIRLVALTGYGLQRDRRLSAAAGFAAHLVKPVEAERLRATIDAVLDASRDPGT